MDTASRVTCIAPMLTDDELSQAGGLRQVFVIVAMMR
jgi:hypothetical protein